MRLIKAQYGRYLNSHIDETLGTLGVDYFVWKHTVEGPNGAENHTAQYDTVFFANPNGEDTIEVNDAGEVVRILPYGT